MLVLYFWSDFAGGVGDNPCYVADGFKEVAVRYVDLFRVMLAAVAGIVLGPCRAAAVELFWDDSTSREVVVEGYNLAVLFCDAPEGTPGDTGGQPGIVSSFKVLFDWFNPVYRPELYIYSVDGDPGEPLAGPLNYTDSEWRTWLVLTLDEPVEVPGEFYILVKPGSSRLTKDGTLDWGIHHSRYYEAGAWRQWDDDLRIRVEWEPQEPSVEAVSWGWIKAGR